MLANRRPPAPRNRDFNGPALRGRVDASTLLAPARKHLRFGQAPPVSIAGGHNGYLRRECRGERLGRGRTAPVLRHYDDDLCSLTALQKRRPYIRYDIT